jgi:two-component system chemotaxis sensor kinase CheA
MREEFIQQVNAELSHLACEAVVNEGAGIDAFTTALVRLAATVAAAPFEGVDALAAAMRDAAASTQPGTESAALAVIDRAWALWRDGERAATAPVVTSDARVDEDVEALRMDPELAGMFIAEAVEHLATIEASVLALEAAPGDNKLLNDIFRPFHTVKGNSGALGVRTVQELAHRVENLLDLGRSGKHRIGEREIEVVLKSVDLLNAMMNDLQRRLNGEPGEDLEQQRLQMMATVDLVIAAEDADEDVEPPAPVLVSVVEPVQESPAASFPPAAGPEAVVPIEPAPSQPIADEAPQRRAEDGPTAVDPATQQPFRRRGEEAAASVKVDTRKLDNMVDMVGELVIVQSIIQQDPALRAVDEKLTRNLAQLRRITSDLQRNAMAMRMVPIRQTFQKMARLVRDLSKRSHKPVELLLSGEDTELDRKVVEDINDPLMHMMRNSVDHGLEDGVTRASVGKPAVGRLALKAYHQGGNIVIEIQDDGQGLNTERIQAKAIAQGLIDADAIMEPAAIHQLIFRPGFSTAEKITEISGRGVGMDVVRRNIEALRGRIEIQSVAGQGTTFLIRLPLTLAIVDGLVVRSGEQRFVLPTFSVRESLRPARDHVHSVHDVPRMVQVRNSLIPLVRLADLFDIHGAITNAWEGTIVVIDDEGDRVALLVDELIGKQEVVIKSLGDAFGAVRGVAGGAIMGDGRIGLILDGHGIVGMMRQTEQSAA